MVKKVFIAASLLVLLSVYAFASTVFVIDSSYNNHGGKVCSIIQEQAPDADVEFIKIANTAEISNFTVISAIYDVVDRVKRDKELRDEGVVLNLSLGSSHYSQSLADAIKAAQNAGIVVVAAAGNDGQYATNYPAALPGVISVGALEYDYYSKKYVTAKYSGSGRVWAPAKHAGTSFSSPFVAGSIANLMDKNDIGAYEASRIVLNNARNNNGVVSPKEVSVRKPSNYQAPKQIVPDSEIVYRLIAFILFRHSRFHSNIVRAMLTTPSSGIVRPDFRAVLIPRRGVSGSSRFPIYKGSGRFFR
ncbi:MAG: S8 family serine peptidase [Candidatus Kaelpia aquatica]|nr:S8 family serine peptidase [Candidatus Kaelpia aquatica]